MKFIRSLTLLALVALSGCSLLNKNATTDQKAQDIYNLSYAAADVGTAVYLAAKPQDRPLFQKAHDTLGTSLALTNLNGATLRAVILSLPVKELKSPQAVIAVDSATFLFDQLTHGQINVESNLVYVVAAGRAVYDGMGAALISIPAPAPSP